jgi:hypothetical protein
VAGGARSFPVLKLIDALLSFLRFVFGLACDAACLFGFMPGLLGFQSSILGYRSLAFRSDPATLSRPPSPLGIFTGSLSTLSASFRRFTLKVIGGGFRFAVFAFLSVTWLVSHGAPQQKVSRRAASTVPPKYPVELRKLGSELAADAGSMPPGISARKSP